MTRRLPLTHTPTSQASVSPQSPLPPRRRALQLRQYSLGLAGPSSSGLSTPTSDSPNPHLARNPQQPGRLRRSVRRQHRGQVVERQVLVGTDIYRKSCVGHPAARTASPPNGCQLSVDVATIEPVRLEGSLLTTWAENVRRKGFEDHSSYVLRSISGRLSIGTSLEPAGGVLPDQLRYLGGLRFIRFPSPVNLLDHKISREFSGWRSPN